MKTFEIEDLGQVFSVCVCVLFYFFSVSFLFFSPLFYIIFVIYLIFEKF